MQLDELASAARRAKAKRAEAEHLQTYVRYTDGAVRAKLLALIADIHSEADTLDSEAQRTLDRIYSVTDTRQRELLLLRYRDGLRWEQVAEAMFYSLSATHRLHRRALAALDPNKTEQE